MKNITHKKQDKALEFLSKNYHIIEKGTGIKLFTEQKVLQSLKVREQEVRKEEQNIIMKELQSKMGDNIAVEYANLFLENLNLKEQVKQAAHSERAKLEKDFEKERKQMLKHSELSQKEAIREERAKLVDDEIRFLDNELFHLRQERASLPSEPSHLRREIGTTINNIEKRLKSIKKEK